MSDLSQWHSIQAVGDYIDLVDRAGREEASLLISLIRELIPLEMDDETLWNSVASLIDKGLVDIQMRCLPDGIEVRPIMMPRAALGGVH